MSRIGPVDLVESVSRHFARTLQAWRSVVAFEGGEESLDGAWAMETASHGLPDAPVDTPAGAVQPLRSILASEPRIVHALRLSSVILGTVSLRTSAGSVVRTPNRLRLRDPRHWLVLSPDTPLTLSSHLGRTCNIHCEFCYLDGNPATLAMARGGRRASDEELDLRWSLYDRASRRELFQSHFQLMEVLHHPRSLQMLGRLRALTPRVLNVTTSGSLLTEDTVRALAELRPLRIWLSLNLVDPALRRAKLRDRNAGTAVRSLELLERHRLPFGVSVVPLPDLPLDAMEEALLTADRYRPVMMRVILPGFTRFDRPAPWHTDWEDAWHRTVRTVRKLRAAVRAPLVVYPQIFEEVHYEPELNGVRILGAVGGSPGAAAGLGHGPWIRMIDGVPVESRDGARATLAAAERERRSVRLGLDDGDESRHVFLGPGSCEYPYSSEVVDYHVQSAPYGIVIGGGLRPEELRALEAVATARDARHVWFLSSPLMRPLVEDWSRRHGFPSQPGLDVRFLAPSSRFMGGNVVIGEMMSFRDFYHAVRAEQARTGDRPDLVVVPSSPLAISGGWLRDLEGVCWRDFERALNLPVAILPVGEIKF